MSSVLCAPLNKLGVLFYYLYIQVELDNLGGVMRSTPMSGENRRLVENESIEVQDFKKFTDHSRGIYTISLKLMKKDQKMSICNRLDLETLGS